MPFIAERFEKGPVLDFWKNLHGNPACHVDAAKRQHLQGKIPRLRAINCGPEIKRPHTNGAFLRQTRLRDEWRRIRIRILKDGMLHAGRKKFVERAETPAGENQLPTYLRIARAHELQQFDLLVGVRREVRMPAFAGYHSIPVIVPEKN